MKHKEEDRTRSPTMKGQWVSLGRRPASAPAPVSGPGSPRLPEDQSHPPAGPQMSAAFLRLVSRGPYQARPSRPPLLMTPNSSDAQLQALRLHWGILGPARPS